MLHEQELPRDRQEEPFNLLAEVETTFTGLQDALIDTPEFGAVTARTAVGRARSVEQPPVFQFQRGEGESVQHWSVQRHEINGSERLVVSVTYPDGGWEAGVVQQAAGRVGPRIGYSKGSPKSPALIRETNTKAAAIGVNEMIARLQSPQQPPGR